MTIGEEIERNTSAITKEWTAYKKAKMRDAKRAARLYAEIMREISRQPSIKSLAYECMPQAYALASANGTLPAHARQIMYQARPYIQNNTDKSLDDQYFTQTLLPDYMQDHLGTTQDWDVVFDARGHLAEPHTGREVPLGTLQVRQYLSEISRDKPAEWRAPKLSSDYHTIGPSNRYQNVLFIEKEGFLPLFRKVKLAQRFDLAIMSTKGLSTTAARRLLEKLRNVRIFVLHDFDKSGFSIVGTLQRDTRRYRFTQQVEVIDLGLRLADVREEQLATEVVYYSERDPRANLRTNGATEEEIEFLYAGGKKGQRVELNAFSSSHLVAWLERKLQEHGVKKVIPAKKTLADAYRHVVHIHLVNMRLTAFHEEAEKAARLERIPRNLERAIERMLKKDPTLAWDEALARIAAKRKVSSIPVPSRKKMLKGNRRGRSK